MTDDELHPGVASMLRGIAPADDETRDRHIAAALEVSRSRTGVVRRARLLSTAAALVLVGTIGFVAGSSRGDGNGDPLAVEALQDSASPVKGATNGAVSRCVLDNHRFLGEYDSSEGPRVILLVVDEPRILVLDASDCSIVAEVDLP